MTKEEAAELVLIFLSTPSARRATRIQRTGNTGRMYFYPRPPRGGRPTSTATTARPTHFYPRPPRGGRPPTDSGFIWVQGISIHALREEGDLGGTSGWRTTPISIHALREEGDFSKSTLSLGKENFYPRPPRGGRPSGAFSVEPHPQISIHALREEGDPRRGGVCQQHHRGFLSTPSARRATAPICWKKTTDIYFYPRPPRGGRLSTPCAT